jgi:AraC-like DNA-binding protein
VDLRADGNVALIGAWNPRGGSAMFAAQADSPVKETLPAWGVFVLESHHSERFRMAMTRSAFLKAIYVLEGSGELRFESGPQRIRRGSVAVVPLGAAHQICDTAGDPLALLVVCVGSVVLDALPDADASFQGKRPCILDEAFVTRETERTLRSLFFEQSLNRPAAPTYMIGLVTQLLAMLARARATPAERASAGAGIDSAGQVRGPETRVRAYIAELRHRFHENEKIDNVTARLGLSRRYFTRLFRKATGSSWLKYVRALRLAHAKTLLQRGERTILAIAFESGFDDVSTFYRAFRSSERTTPQEWLARQAPAKAEPSTDTSRKKRSSRT